MERNKNDINPLRSRLFSNKLETYLKLKTTKLLYFNILRIFTYKESKFVGY